ncbi:MAG: ABC transporter ATP-binding protein [Thaumarchaeota archaeon]|nr:ABC transporter ATP-binding protein [Nitrososphaerota archaeon]
MSKKTNKTKKYSLVVKNLNVNYKVAKGSINAVNNVSFQIKPGEALGIVGESGCGKTTIALSLIRLLPRNVSKLNGNITLNDKKINKLSDDTFRKTIKWKQISMVFQGAMNSLNPVLRIGDQIIEPLVNTGESKSIAKKSALELLDLVGLSKETYSKYPHELSGGMKQRVIIAMAMIHHPGLIILDEPTSALDVSVQAQIMNLLKSLKLQGISMIFITHDIALTSDLCDNLAVMKDGKFIEYDSLVNVLNNPQHNFTKQLIQSVPSLSVSTTRKISSTKKEILDFKNIKVDFIVRKGLLSSEPFTAVSDVSLKINQGETLALVGESGSGKTTLGRVALNLIEPVTGRVKFQGSFLNNSDDFSFRKKAQAIFQDPYSSINSFMTIYQILEEPLIIHNIDKSLHLEKINLVLKDVNLTPTKDYLNKYPHMLSGGQRQRVGIARALILDSKFIVADEPVSMIDASSRLEILGLLNNLQFTKNLSFLYITHDIATARQFSDRIAVMFFGRIVELGKSNEIVKNPLHPYTRSLIEAIPTLDPDNLSKMRKVISRDNFHPQCTFHNKKSNRVMDYHLNNISHKCRKKHPKLNEIKKNHFVACHL